MTRGADVDALLASVTRDLRAAREGPRRSSPADGGVLYGELRTAEEREAWCAEVDEAIDAGRAELRRRR